MSTYHFITSDAGDWIALYKSGALVTEGHSLDGRELLRALSIPFTEEEWDEAKFEEHGYRCPELLP